MISGDSERSFAARAASEPPRNTVTTSRAVCSWALISWSMKVSNGGTSAVSFARRRLRTGSRSMGSPARAFTGPFAVFSVRSSMP